MMAMIARATSGEATSAAGPTPRRLPSSHFEGITGVRLSPYGASAAVVSITPTGALVECTVRLTVDAPVQVTFEGQFTPKTSSGRVARCEVATMGRDGMIRYHVSIAFDRPLSEHLPPPAAALEAVAAPAPVRNRW